MSEARPLRLVYASEVDISIDNGRGINEREFVRWLLRDHEEDVICVLPNPERPDTFFDERIEYVAAHHHGGIRYPVHVVSAILRVIRLHREQPLDGLITRLEVTPLLAWVAHRIGVPIFLKTVAVYGPFESRPPDRRKLHQWVQWGFRPIFRTVIESATAADTMSYTFAEWLRETFDLPEGRIRVIENGANVDVFRPGTRDACRRKLGLERFRRIVGYAGVLDRQRHLEVLVNAFADSSSAGDVGLVLLGWGPDRERLEALARTRGISDRVLFPGTVPYTAVPEYLRAFDIGIDLSAMEIALADRAENASFSQKIAQYLASGLPVLAWNLRDTRFLESHDLGALASFPSRESLSEALDDLLSLSEGEFGKVQARAREYATSHLSAQEITRKRMTWWREFVLARREPKTQRSIEEGDVSDASVSPEV